jgi:hypothetical protein
MSFLAKLFGFVHPAPVRRGFAVSPQGTRGMLKPHCRKDFRSDRHAAIAIINGRYD